MVEEEDKEIEEMMAKFKELSKRSKKKIPPETVFGYIS